MVEIVNTPSGEAPALAPGQTVSDDVTNDDNGAATDDGQQIANVDRPEWLPEKFKTPEDMARAYAELEQKQSRGADDKSEDDADGAKDGEGEGDENAIRDEFKDVTYGNLIDETLTNAGLSAAQVAQEWTDTGKLSEETFAALERSGISRATVEQYIRGAQEGVAENSARAELAQRDTNAIKGLAGGPEGYDAMVQWAATNLTEAQIAAYDAAVTSGDRATIDIAVRGLYATYTDAVGHQGRFVSGGGSPPGDVFQSSEQAADAMTAARRSGDPAQIKAVEQKMLRSNVFNQGT